MQVQRGRYGLLPPTHSARDAVSFEFAQGPADSRFVYVNSGTRAGQFDSCRDRRAKVALPGITAAQAGQVLADDGLILEARIFGKTRDGGPMCASVPLLGGGWTVIRAKSFGKQPT